MSGGVDQWEPLKVHEVQDLDTWGVGAGLRVPLPTEEVQLSTKGREKFLKTLSSLKAHFGIADALKVRTINNFPADCGIASSASSFAALTLGVALYRGGVGTLEMPALGMLSAGGSGSSSRSFLGPWCAWRAEGLTAPQFLFPELVHGVFLVSDRKKLISSSEAHRRVMESLNFQGRVHRAELRHRQLDTALTEGDWARAKDLVWAEFWDMHSLFETASPPFGYLEVGSFEVLGKCRELWDQEGDGPLVTMDAGPNVHVLFRTDQKPLRERLRSRLSNVAQIWSAP